MYSTLPVFPRSSQHPRYSPASKFQGVRNGGLVAAKLLAVANNRITEPMARKLSNRMEACIMVGIYKYENDAPLS
jgi:hypothetical protein